MNGQTPTWASAMSASRSLRVSVITSTRSPSPARRIISRRLPSSGRSISNRRSLAPGTDRRTAGKASIRVSTPLTLSARPAKTTMGESASNPARRFVAGAPDPSRSMGTCRCLASLCSTRGSGVSRARRPARRNAAAATAGGRTVVANTLGLRTFELPAAAQSGGPEPSRIGQCRPGIHRHHQAVTADRGSGGQQRCQGPTVQVNHVRAEVLQCGRERCPAPRRERLHSAAQLVHLIEDIGAVMGARSDQCGGRVDPAGGLGDGSPHRLVAGVLRDDVSDPHASASNHPCLRASLIPARSPAASKDFRTTIPADRVGCASSLPGWRSTPGRATWLRASGLRLR